MFGFMLDETEATDTKVPGLNCRSCHLRLAQRAPRVIVGEDTFHRDCFEAAHKKRTGRRPALVPYNGDRVTFRPAA